jgi:hypothetical protein
MTVSQLEGYTAGVLGHTSYKVSENTVYLTTLKDVRKMCLALVKQRYSFTFNSTKLSITIIGGI